MKRTKPPRIFVLKLRALPGVDSIKALRMALKQLLRRHQLRCVSVHEEIITHDREQGDENAE